MSVLNLPEPKDMREQIQSLARCQIQTNAALREICEALEVLTHWVKHQETINRLTLNKLEL